MKNSGKPTEIIDKISRLKAVDDLEILIKAINDEFRNKMDKRKEKMENVALWTSSITAGDEVLKFVKEHTGDKEYSFNSAESTKVLTEILELIGKAHWIVGGLCIVAYLVDKVENVSSNKRESFNLLEFVVKFASTVKKLKDVMPEEENNFRDVVPLIVQGSIMCISQMKAHKFMRFLKTSVNSESLTSLSKQIGNKYQALNLIGVTNLSKHQSKRLPLKKPPYPDDAVGIKVPEEEVRKLLLTPQQESPLAVIIYGFGGIGKTLLAHAVLAGVDMKAYSYARVYLEDGEKSESYLKDKQKIILKDAFPNFQYSEPKLRDCMEGRERLQEAFQCTKNKPLMLFIDNASKSDLKKLLPHNLQCLPKQSRILLTTRKVDIIQILKNGGLECRDYLVRTLPDEEAKQIFCKDTVQRDQIYNMERFLKICGGIPYVLRIVGDILASAEYEREYRDETLGNLEKGKDITHENLRKTLLYFVFEEFDCATEDAFLDICCFFNGRYRRHLKYVVGALQIKSLEEAGLFTSVVVGNDNGVDAGEQKITIHNMLKAQGKNMSQSTRIMDSRSWKKIANNEAELKKIKGIWLEDGPCQVEERHLSSTAEKLRILSLGDKIKISGQSEMEFKELRYLKVGNCMCQLPMQIEDLDRLRVYEGPVEDVNL